MSVEDSKEEIEVVNHNEGVNEDIIFLKPDFIKPIKRKKSSISNDTQKLNEESNSNGTLKGQTYPVSEEVNQSNVKTEKSPSEKLAEKEIPIPYKEPSWSGLPICQYEFEVIKNGVVIDTVPFNKPFIVIGRLSNCDVVLEHPSISRFHCVVQYRKEDDEHKGLYVYDLDSTHGTFQNKFRLLPKVFNRLKVGHMIKFGGSSRLFILQGPDEDQEPESELTITELKAKATERKQKLQALESGELDKDFGVSGSSQKLQEKDSTSEGIDWGMGEDAVEDEEEEEEGEGFINPFSTNEELFLNDPKKTLRGWYEREGYDLPDYLVEELKPGTFKAKLELPVSGPGSKPLICIVEHKGKKKDAVIQCALEACRMLDRQGLLRQSTHESHEKKRKKWSENDYYDSDEDDFLDRTGDIERKRNLRKREHEASKGIADEVVTYESLSKQYEEVIKCLEKLETDLKRVEELKNEQYFIQSDSSAFSDADELEAYMAHLSSQLPDKYKRIAWKMEAVKLGKEEIRLRKLVNISRPLRVAELPERKSLVSDSKNTNTKKSFEETTLYRKTTRVRKVHAAFLDEEEEVKPKLRKINCKEDDDDVVPIPYSQPQRTLSKYDAMRKKMLPRFNNSIVIQASSSAAQDDSVTMKSSKNSLREDSKDLQMNNEEVLIESSKNSSSGISGEDSKDLLLSSQKDSSETSEEEIRDSGSRITDGEPEGGEVVRSESNLSNVQIKVIGPSLPPSNTSLEFSKPLMKEQKKIKLKKEEKKNAFDFDEKYETWVPPSGQTGDGRTSLNDKLGY